MEIKYYQLDVFTDRIFGGNIAGVCLLVDWLPDDILQAIACENNLPTTAFLVPRDNNYHIRWFTPKQELELCGHGTLAASYVVLKLIDSKRPGVTFHSLSGSLTCSLSPEDQFILEFPTLPFSLSEKPALLEQVFPTMVECYKAKEYLIVILPNEKLIRDWQPDFAVIKQLETQNLVITAKADHVDFVSRYFAPIKGIDEDHATGSIHCMLAPFWAERLGKAYLHAKQLSNRLGEIFCEVKGNRVLLKGKAMLYMQGIIKLT